MGDLGSTPGLGRFPGEVIGYPLQYSWASLVAQMVKNHSTMRETWIQSLGWEDPLEKGRATHSSIVAWRIPWTEDPGRLQSMGMQRVRHNWVTKPSPAQHKDTHVTFHKEHCSAGFFSCDVFVRPQCQSNNDQICRSYDMFFSVSIFWNSFGKISIL